MEQTAAARRVAAAAEAEDGFYGRYMAGGRTNAWVSGRTGAARCL